VAVIDDIDFIVTASELEALILESNLIKRHKPKYNVRLKDDKRYPYIKVTWQEDFPRVLIVRRMERDGARYYGPFTAAWAVQQTLHTLRRIRGVKRPALTTILPMPAGRVVTIDIGANADCRPSHLLQFAHLGSTYARHILGIEQPRIGLLSNGEEEGKGTELTREVHEVLSQTNLNYIGYVEGRHLNSGSVDVIVCDGFVGNVALKISEGLWETIHTILKWEAQDNLRAKVAYFLMGRVMRRLEKKVDYSEFGGAPLLGVNGNCVISHGHSNAKAIMNAILLAENLAKNKLNEHVIQELRENQDLLRLGQKNLEKTKNSIKTVQNSITPGGE